MKKHIRRALAMAVCLIMVIGTMAPYVFAEDDNYSVGATIELGSTVTPPTNIPEGTEWQKVSERTAYDCGKAEGSVEYYYKYRMTGWLSDKTMVYDGPLYRYDVFKAKHVVTNEFRPGITYGKTDGIFGNYWEILYKRNHSHSDSGCNANTYYTWKLVEKAAPTEPAAPTDSELKDIFDGKISVECQNTDANHASKTYGLLDGSYTVGEVKDNKCTVTIAVAKYIDEYNKFCSGHYRYNFDSVFAGLTYNPAKKEWRLNAAKTIKVICYSIPDAPTAGELAAVQGAVRVECTTDVTNHQSKAYSLGELNLGTDKYTVGDVELAGTGFYTCEVTLSDDAVNVGIAEYNKSYAYHESAGNHTNKVVLRYQNNAWVLVDAAVINVKCNSGEIENKPAVVIEKTFFGLSADEQSKAAEDIVFHVYKKAAGEDNTWIQLPGDIKLSKDNTAEIYGLEKGASYYITESGAETVIGDDGSKYLLYDTHYSVVSESAVAYSSNSAIEERSGEFEYKGETVRVGVYNSYAAPASFTIEKVDKDNPDTKLQNAEFTLWELYWDLDTDKWIKTEVYNKLTDKDGLITFDNLKPGYYVLKETKAPAGYKDNNDEWFVDISSSELKPLVLDSADTYAAADNRVSVCKIIDGKELAPIDPVDGKYIIENEADGGGYVPVDPTPATGTLTVTKTVTGFETLPEGYNVTITVKQGDKVIRTATLSSFTDGKATYSFYGLPAGTYTVSETAADVDGYKLEAAADQTVTVTAGGTATAEFVNAYTKVDEPVTPDDPENPDVPDKPDKPEKPETPKDNAVKTGDTANTGIAWGVFGAALLGLGGFAVRRRKASK